MLASAAKINSTCYTNALAATANDFYFPDRESLGMGQNFDFGILVDLHVLRSTESKKVFFTKCLSVVCPGQ